MAGLFETMLLCVESPATAAVSTFTRLVPSDAQQTGTLAQRIGTVALAVAHATRLAQSLDELPGWFPIHARRAARLESRDAVQDTLLSAVHDAMAQWDAAATTDRTTPRADCFRVKFSVTSSSTLAIDEAGASSSSAQCNPDDQSPPIVVATKAELWPLGLTETNLPQLLQLLDQHDPSPDQQRSSSDVVFTAAEIASHPMEMLIHSLLHNPATPNPIRNIRIAPPECWVRAANPALAHKTIQRGIYDRAKAGVGSDCFDVLLVNDQQHVTEAAIANIAIRETLADGHVRWITPPLCAGILPGTLRAELVRAGLLHEALITVQMLQLAVFEGRASIFCMNSLRGIYRVALLF
ncbi:hypothetical protein CAOG_08014 [Capsaspora owczarzaki ATCC 30864]|uniref:Uncharacterized protein n=1 Tax=Capsaspora owczarzaki (strain ATCC 30864) TaxID=595528 RepID=A0A0D2WXK2_CAPO3|nr:hypothetical protein CAOG_08014 [Capsaspora owczarzaki ATCC 30864]KJE97950.1 hypothetical protein CAOG_008014 [Capsaspora owczarzaki ATCC 30864]|eukprot:XP_004342615.1 hypothetical protein CAOG_08014 [Capsaspora owczarzaki ATCC 30864]